MSEEKALPVPTAVELKQEELTFGVDEAVEVLSTMYETKRRIKLDSERTVLDAAIEVSQAITDEVKGSIDTAEYNHTSEILGISSRVKDVELNLGKTIEDSNVRVVLMLTDTDITGSNYTPEFGKYRNLSMDEGAFNMLTNSATILSEAKKAYNKVSTKLDNVSDIRRQLRAKVMSVKLTEAGLGEVLTDESVLEIIEV